MGSKICDNCRRKLRKTTVDKCVESDSEQEEQEVDVDEVDVDEVDVHSSEGYIDSSVAISSLNQCLAEIGETPYIKRKAHQRHYPEQKIKKITDAMKRTFITDCDNSLGDEDETCVIVEQLRKKFELSTSRSEQLQILTVLPQSWTHKKIQSVFQTSNYMARKSKQLVKEKGILSTPNPKHGHSLPPKTLDLIKSFYESDNISRTMPGKKDFVSIRQGEKRVQVQKRLVLSNLKEVYHAFKVEFPNEKVGFSKFAECRPRNCVLAGASGTHSVCVCTIHQNVKLMLQGVKLSSLSGTSLVNYHDCLIQILCNPPSPNCYLGSCAACPGIDVLRDNLVALLDENLIDNVTFKQWVSVDRSTLETYSTSADDFVDKLCEKLELLRPHYFIASQQADFYKDCKLHLSPGEMLVTVDFSENYSFVLQDAAQGYHWNNSQATIHPFVGYYTDSGEIQHLSYVIISECLNHDTAAVYLFQKCFITFLSKVIPAGQPIKRVIYFSDGAAAQYKNRKNFLNLCHHGEDFGLPAEWHFSATSHGKGACDGLGGTVKRLAARASLQRPYDQQIMTPRQLFDWATTAVPTVHFEYCTMQDYEREKQNLEQRFQASQTIQGTRKLHSFVPTSKDTLAVKPYSASALSKEVKVTLAGTCEMPLENISGFVTCVYEQKWWLGCVLQVDQEDPEVTVTLLHPHGPCSSFRYPATPADYKRHSDKC
jgi:hypothetical protein